MTRVTLSQQDSVPVISRKSRAAPATNNEDSVSNTRAAIVILMLKTRKIGSGSLHTKQRTLKYLAEMHADKPVYDYTAVVSTYNIDTSEAVTVGMRSSVAMR